MPWAIHYTVSSSSQLFGLSKFSLSTSSPDIIAHWNVTIYEIINNSLEYFIAHAGYCLIDKVSYSFAGIPYRVILNAAAPHTMILVSGLYLDEEWNLLNDTPGLKLNCTDGDYTSGGFPGEIIPEYNRNSSFINISVDVQNHTFVRFNVILKSPPNSITVTIGLSDRIFYQTTTGFGGLIAQYSEK